MIEVNQSGVSMKTIQIELSGEARRELLRIRKKSDDYRGERALAVLHCADGMRPCQIAGLLKRSSQTVCKWLHAYRERGAAGLSRKFSPGRPSLRKAEIIPKLPEYLAKSPADFGWGEDVWSVKVIMAQLEKDNGRSVSRHTVIRALNDAGYSAKRSKKTTPSHAPSKAEKLERVKRIAAEINGLKDSADVEVMFLDESHFSTDPYVVRGWSRRGEPFFPPDSEKTRGMHDIWGVRAGKRRFLLEKLG